MSPRAKTATTRKAPVKRATKVADITLAPTTDTQSDETVKRATYSGICSSCGSYIVVGQTHGCLR